MKYRFLSAAAAAAVTLSLCSVQVQAAESGVSKTEPAIIGVCGGLTFMIQNGVMKISGTGRMPDYPLHGSDEENAPWYEYKDQITSLVIGEGIQNIGESAFYHCINLTEVTIPDSVTSIGETAFLLCDSLETVSIPAGVTEIGFGAFGENEALTAITVSPDNPNYCDRDGVLFEKNSETLMCYPAGKAETSYAIPEGTDTVEIYAFSGCEALTSVSVPASVTVLNDQAFEGVYGLRQITVDPENTAYCAEDGVLYTKGQTELIKYPDNKDALSYTVPVQTSRIRAGAVSRSADLLDIYVMNAKCEFCDDETTGYRAVDLYGTVLHGQWSSTAEAYAEKHGYHYLRLSSSGNLAGGGTNDGFRWQLSIDGTLTISGNVPMRDFEDSSKQYWMEKRQYIRNIVIEDGVESIGDYAFCDLNGVTSVTIPASVKTVGFCAFAGCSHLTSVSMAEGVTKIGTDAFKGCSRLPSVTLPDSITSIGSFAFAECTGLQEINLPKNLSDIEPWAFSGCIGLKEITLPAGAYFGASVFDGCSGLENIYADPDHPDYTSVDGVLFNKNRTEILCYPDGRKDTSYTIPPQVISIGDDAFSGCEGLQTVIFSDTVTEIGDSAFSYCTGLESADIPESVQEIGDGAFYGCSSLVQANIPAGTVTIGDAAFVDCRSLKAFSVSEDNPNYCSEDGILFSKDQTLLIQYPCEADAESYTVPDSVRTIGQNAFYCNERLKGITIPDSVETIEDWGLCRCMTLESVKIGEGVKSIGYGGFLGCDNLKEVTVPASVTTIGKRAFENCDLLQQITVLNPKCEIGEDWMTLGYESVIRGYAGSTAEEFAKQNERQFVPLEGAAERTKGDADGDGAVTNKDAQYVLTAYTESLTTGVTDMPEADAKAADVDGSGSVGAADAQYILVYYTENTIAGNKTTWEMLITS